MTSQPHLIHIVDDDPAIRDALSLVFDLGGFRAESFQSGDAFLSSIGSAEPHCVILDVHMPGLSGIDILKRLQERDFSVPVFIISGQGDIPMAVEAIKQGAHDFIEKPFDADTVLTRVREAIEASQKNAAKAEPASPAFPGADSLTPREREVLDEITAGASNKEAGRTLGISPRTIEVHRARIMEKLGARNAADLVRIVMTHTRAPD
ncbi:response regulator transcription factor [Stappia taiwanensis]|uniref:Response regulator transcription factor n=1 Tax=Stappia taiwanensis TaxID=992267 RepID=A0A838XTL9_9HYPH|nr:response regulator [Stappia taiwanensis]MBA4613772.1 response regulator transcription factor [Stappia taiwanensis]GGE93491.1 DNA-binding response regulator [Stappia taiwanensis]